MALFGFENWKARDQDPALREAWIASEKLKSECDWSHLPGRCGLCGATIGFRLAEGADRRHPDIRENLLCICCGHNARVRAGLQLLLDNLPQGACTSVPEAPAYQVNSPRILRRLGERIKHTWRQRGPGALPAIYLTEQVTPTFLWLQHRLRAKLHGSEFQPEPAKLHALTQAFRRAGGIGKVQFQDVTRLAWPNECLDAIVTFDVLEHVPDYTAAITEFARTLRPGGICVATFPFTDGPNIVVRAKLGKDGSIVHLLEPEYHGDPISGGVLCFYHFGWDVLDTFRAAGFRNVRMVMPWDHKQGYLYGLWTVLATR